MNAIKTTAIVENSNHLILENEFKNLKHGTQVDIVILTRAPSPIKNWKQVLNNIGTYSEEELSGFYEIREELNQWQPKEF